MTPAFFYHPKNKKRPRAFRPGRLIKLSLKLLLGASLFSLLLGLAVFTYFAKDLPDPEKISDRQIIESTKIFDRTGQILLYEIHGEEKRTVISFDQISPYVKQATMAIEDASFYQHFGLDFRGILRAAFYNLLGKSIAQGGSTISQQFVKKALLSDERTWSRKVKEAILALELERKYSKDEILGFYLNQIPYGSNTYGIEAAAQTFFNKPAGELTLSQSAVLAALPNAPSRLSPYGSYPEELKTRQEYILDRMASLGYVSEQEAQEAKKEKLTFSPHAYGIKAPHFVMYVKEYLENKYGRDYLESAGLKVYTTLDWDLQQVAEKIIAEGAQTNWNKYRAANAALAAVDPQSGQILVMVGSANYFDLAKDGNVNVTIRDRQPGSSFKPFAYVTAFEKGYTADTILFDLKTEFNPNCSADGSQEKDHYGLDCYSPSNYDGTFRGPVTARQALAQSLNVPSVKMLYLADINKTIATAKNMGITSLNAPYYGLSLVLGGGEVKLLDQVAAFGVFAADGIKHDKASILKIEDGNGKIIEEFVSKPNQIINPQYARMISDILSDNQARAPVFGTNSPLYFPGRPVAAKTGTTQFYRDAWTLGYTPSLVAGVWAGNNDGSPMTKSGAGLYAAAPLWHEFLKQAYDLKKGECQPGSFCLPKNPEHFIEPEPIITEKSMLNGFYLSEIIVEVDKISGQLATDQTPPDLIEKRSFKQVHSLLYFVQKDNPQGDPPANPSEDPQFNNWETPVLSWLAQNNQYNIPFPTDYDSIHTPANLPSIKIISPFNNQVINQPTFIFQVEASAPLGLKQVDYFLNDEFIGSSLMPPYQIIVKLPDYIINATSSQSATLKARAYDNVFNRQEEKIEILIK